MTAATRSGGLLISRRWGAAGLLLALAAWGQQPKFSHREALQKPGVRCVDWHAGAASGTASSGKRNIRFNHKLHLAMGNLAPVLAATIDSGKYPAPAGDIRRHLNDKDACGACHRGIEETDAVTKANFPQMADCLVCHNKIELPFSCEKCHLNTAVLKPAGHTADYLESHSRKNVKLDKPSCRICHGVDFRCMGCH